MAIPNEIRRYLAEIKEKPGQARKASVKELSKVRGEDIIKTVVKQLITNFGEVWDSKDYTDDEKKEICKDVAEIIQSIGPDAVHEVIRNLNPTIMTGKVTEIGFWSEYAARVLAALGEMVIPYLTLSLERSSYVHQALGLLGSEAALQVLFDELRSSDWRRVAAAAQGLGIARNPRANEHLYAAGRAATVGEAAIAIDAAIRRCGGQFPYPLTSAAGGSTGSVCDVNDASFDAEILNSTLPALVDFWAPWCGPCRAIAPVVEELARDYAGRVKVAKMNVDENTGTTSRYGLRAIPTIIIFKGGQVVEQITGAVPKTTIEGALKKFI